MYYAMLIIFNLTLFLGSSACQTGYMPPLHRAVQAGDIDQVDQLLSAERDINKPAGAFSETPLLYYLRTADFTQEDDSRPENMVTALLARGANVNVKNGQGESPLDQLMFRDFRLSGSGICWAITEKVSSDDDSYRALSLAVEKANFDRVNDIIMHLDSQRKTIPQAFSERMSDIIKKKADFNKAQLCAMQAGLLRFPGDQDIMDRIKAINKELWAHNEISLLLGNGPIEKDSQY